MIPQELVERLAEARSKRLWLELLGEEGAGLADYTDDAKAAALAEAREDVELIWGVATAQLVLERAAHGAELDRWKSDYQKALNGEPVAACEGCGAQLFEGDDYVSDPGDVHGCWHTMTDIPPKRERACYAYRVGKCHALDKADRGASKGGKP